MLNFIVVSEVLFNRDFDPFLNVVHVFVEVGNVFNTSDWLRDVQGLLFVDNLLNKLVPFLVNVSSSYHTSIVTIYSELSPLSF